MFKSHFKMRSDPIYTNPTFVTVNRGQEELGHPGSVDFPSKLNKIIGRKVDRYLIHL